MHQATCLSLTHEVWCRVKRTRSYNGDLITTFPFVTRWSHHFHTFLSDQSGRVWSYLIWLCSSRPGNLADDDMTSPMSACPPKSHEVSTRVSSGQFESSHSSRGYLTKQTISKSNSISQIRLFHSSVTRLLSRNIARISHEKFSFLFHISMLLL